MKVSERKIRKTSLKEESDDLKNTTSEQRWAMMRQRTLDARAFEGETVAEPKLQRHIVRVFRRES